MRVERLDRTVVIRATPDTVFGFFTDSGRWASWWGPGSTIDPQPGGEVLIRYANGVEASGKVVDVQPPERFVFTFGFASGQPMGPGASVVTLALSPHAEGTRLVLTHEFDDAAARDPHVAGWRYQLAVFANVVADLAYADAASAIDTWFRAWAEPDEAARRAALARVVADTVRVHDRFSLLAGLDDLVAHIGAAQRFMPGVSMARAGDVRQCQGMALADWAATSPDGQPRGRGTTAFTFGLDGRIAAVTGFWG